MNIEFSKKGLLALAILAIFVLSVFGAGCVHAADTDDEFYCPCCDDITVDVDYIDIDGEEVIVDDEGHITPIEGVVWSWISI